MNAEDDGDLNDALDMLYPRSCDPPLPPLADVGPLAQRPSLLPLDSCESDHDGSDAGRKNRRRVGRPRAMGRPAAHASLAEAAAENNKRGRGPKPKYIFATEDEAMDARRERNRKAALESYYRKRQKLETMQEELNRLAEENAALVDLLGKLETGETQLKEASDDGVNAWLASRAPN